VKSVIRAIAAAVQRAPLAVVIATLVLFGIFGYLSGQAEISQGNEGFAPENPELLASERITELFGSSAQETVMQIIVRAEGGDVFTADALDLAGRIEQALRRSGVLAWCPFSLPFNRPPPKVPRRRTMRR
jgi:predicted RND superfamily exporter protein